MDFSHSIDPMGIRNPDSDEKQHDSMGFDKIPIVSYLSLGLDILDLVSFSFVLSCIIQKKDEYIDYFSQN